MSIVNTFPDAAPAALDESRERMHDEQSSLPSGIKVASAPETLPRWETKALHDVAELQAVLRDRSCRPDQEEEDKT